MAGGVTAFCCSAALGLVIVQRSWWGDQADPPICARRDCRAAPGGAPSSPRKQTWCRRRGWVRGGVVAAVAESAASARGCFEEGGSSSRRGGRTMARCPRMEARSSKVSSHSPFSRPGGGCRPSTGGRAIIASQGRWDRDQRTNSPSRHPSRAAADQQLDETPLQGRHGKLIVRFLDSPHRPATDAGQGCCGRRCDGGIWPS